MAFTLPTDPPLIIDANTLFTNVAGAVFTAESNNTNAITVTVSGSTLTLTPVGVGGAVITVTATVGTGDDARIATTNLLLTVDPPPAPRQAYGPGMLITVDIGEPMDLHVCSMAYDYTIDGQRYAGVGRMMGIGPVQVSQERDEPRRTEIQLIVDDDVPGLSAAIQQIGAAPVTITYYNERA